MRLEAEALAIGYGHTEIGRGIDLSIASGDILCLLGPNGCGKTTLFRTLRGLIPALDGRLTLGGAPLAHLSRAEIVRRIAYVPQAHAPPFPFEAREVVLMGRTARLGRFAQPGRADHAAARAGMERLGIADLAHADYSRLSGGQRQRNSRGQGVVLSTHDPDQAFALDARVLLMKDGRIFRRGAPDEALTAETLGAVYGLPVTVERTASGRRVCLPALGPQSTPTMTSEALTTA